VQTNALEPGALNMPWDESYYPASMHKLSPIVRSKSIEIANALLTSGVDEGKAIRIAIATARHWAERQVLRQGVRVIADQIHR
jgi:uncharacterized protein YdaT